MSLFNASSQYSVSCLGIWKFKVVFFHLFYSLISQDFFPLFFSPFCSHKPILQKRSTEVSVFNNGIWGQLQVSCHTQEWPTCFWPLKDEPSCCWFLLGFLVLFVVVRFLFGWFLVQFFCGFECVCGCLLGGFYFFFLSFCPTLVVPMQTFFLIGNLHTLTRRLRTLITLCQSWVFRPLACWQFTVKHIPYLILLKCGMQV